MLGIIGVEKSPGTVATYCKRFPGTQKNQPLKMSIMIISFKQAGAELCQAQAS